MKSSNEISLDIAGNADVKDALEGYSVGDEVILEIRCTVKSVDDQTFTGTVEEITCESCDEEDAEESGTTDDEAAEGEGDTADEAPADSKKKSAKVDAQSPISVILFSGSRKK